jgi:transcriptional regulator with PAS, ATPase and Fis domain
MFTRLGETKQRQLKARLVFATNKDLRKEMQTGGIRSDFYYRLANHVIHLPALSERCGDIACLSDYFLKKYSSQYGRALQGISSEAMDVLNAYSFPGNVRELEGIISGAVLIEKTAEVQAASLPAYLRYGHSLDNSLEASRYREVIRTLSECANNQTKAAKRLGVARQTLSRWLKEFRDQGKI